MGYGDPLSDYFYNFDEAIDAQYLYFNRYVTRAANTFTNMDPYIDTLNFSTFPYYTVEIGNQVDTVGYQLSITTDNIDEYATLYPLNELNTSENDWCNNVLVQYESNCPDSIEVNFDYSLSISSTTGKEIDTVSSQAVFENNISVKSVNFNVSWTNIDSIFWDTNNERYDIMTPDSSESLSASLIDSTDYFDSLIYVGVIDTNQHPIEGMMFIDRTEWERHDIRYESIDKPISLDTTFVYYKVNIPDDSPMYHINGDCNQNLDWDVAEVYHDYGLDWCPDSLETGQGNCIVIDADEDGELFDEIPCNCLGDWREFLDANGDVPNPNYNGPVEENSNWKENNNLDPNGDNWNDCGLDGICPGHPDDTNGNENNTENNNSWDRGEGYEKNNQYDYDDLFGGIVKPGEFFVDEVNGVLDLAEHCVTGNDGQCNGNDPFEDRNCNGIWDDAESVDAGNGVWDDDEHFIDTNENGEWETGEPLYVFSDRLETLIVDYTNPDNPVAVTHFDQTTSVVLYYGNVDTSSYIVVDSFLEQQLITETRSKSFHDIDSLVTIYTNKIIEHPLSGVEDDYYIAKTKWFQSAVYNIDKPYYGDDYGYDYHLFQFGDNGEVYKVLHPSYFKYYGYYNNFEEFAHGFWDEEIATREDYIRAPYGLRDGEYDYSDTIIVTPFADYYVEKTYEVEKIDTISVPMKKEKYNEDYSCISNVKTSWISDHNIIPPFNCPPADTILNNVYKIINTKLITMVGNGLEFGLRNTIWLGSAGVGNPLGVVKDKLEIRWSEPFWEEYGSGWSEVSRLELTSFRKNDNVMASRRYDFLNLNNNKLSLKQIGNEFDNDGYKFSPLYGLHRLPIPNEK